MKQRHFALWLILLSLFLFCHIGHLNAASAPTWSVYFSPHGGCADAIVEELGNAKSSVLFQAYSFASAPIAKALS